MHQSNLNPDPMSMTPEIASYPSRSRYDNNYPNTVHPLAHPVPRRGTSSKTQRVGDRFMPHPASGTQWDPPIIPSLDPIDPFVSPPFYFPYALCVLTIPYSFKMLRKGIWWAMLRMIIALDTNENDVRFL